MNPPPVPPPDDEFSRMIAGALNDGDLSLTEHRRVAVLGAFADAARTDGGPKRPVIHIAWWLAAGAAAACVALWLSGIFSASPESAEDLSRSGPVVHETSPAGEQLELANLRLAVLSDQLSRAEHQLLWLQATEKKRQSN